MSFAMERSGIPDRALNLADQVDNFVRETVVPFERDPRLGARGPSEELSMVILAGALAMLSFLLICLCPSKLCHNFLETEDRNYGSEALFGRRYFEAVTRD
jgi:hypothetical protein